jgi:hypothetical protein
VPVEAKVAVIFFATCPALPMPVRMTLPVRRVELIGEFLQRLDFQAQRLARCHQVLDGGGRRGGEGIGQA